MTKKQFDRETQLANAAFLQAAKKVIDLAEQTGTPVVVWEDGKIAKIDPKVMRERIFPSTKK
jgi:murein DD-endopeptidase MepM/ murein hydrolase activator NlpD